jgi:hypothetical protein
MMFAAYDVLLNKRMWRDKSIHRRDVWRPDIGPLTPDGTATFVRQHSAPRMSAQLLDRYRAFPIDLSVGNFTLGEDCWPRSGPERTTAPQGGIQIVPGQAIGPRPNRGPARALADRPQ